MHTANIRSILFDHLEGVIDRSNGNLKMYMDQNTHLDVYNFYIYSMRGYLKYSITFEFSLKIDDFHLIDRMRSPGSYGKFEYYFFEYHYQYNAPDLIIIDKKIHLYGNIQNYNSILNIQEHMTKNIIFTNGSMTDEEMAHLYYAPTY